MRSSGRIFDDLEGELGDLLLQVVYHAQMAKEAGRFDFETVAARIADKMIRRHPHVFGAAEVESAAAQSVAWEDAKAAERAQKAGGRRSEHPRRRAARPAGADARAPSCSGAPPGSASTGPSSARCSPSSRRSSPR